MIYKQSILKGASKHLFTLLKSQCDQLRGKVKEKWGELTDDNLDQVEGKIDQLIGVVQEKYELTRSKAEAEVNEFLTSK